MIELLPEEIAYLEAGTEHTGHINRDNPGKPWVRVRCLSCGHLEALHNGHCCSFCMIPGCTCEWGEVEIPDRTMALTQAGEKIVFCKRIWQNIDGLSWQLDFPTDKGVVNSFVTFSKRDMENNERMTEMQNLILAKLDNVLRGLREWCEEHGALLI